MYELAVFSSFKLSPCTPSVNKKPLGEQGQSTAISYPATGQPGGVGGSENIEQQNDREKLLAASLLTHFEIRGAQTVERCV